MVLTMHSTMSGMFDQADELSEDATAMGKDFDAAKTDDSFYLPHEVLLQPGLPAGREAVPVAGRQGSSLHHLAQG